MRYEREKYRCENPDCDAQLYPDHVTLITTEHVRRFCTVECLVESWKIATLQKRSKKV
jgi:hypothetical protein